MDKTLSRGEERVLTVIYALSAGAPGIRIRKDALLAECNRLNLFGMSDEEFQRYKRDVVARLRRHPN